MTTLLFLAGMILMFMFMFWVGWVVMDITWKLCAKTSESIDLLFEAKPAKDSQLSLEIKQLNEQYDNLVQEYNQSKIEASSKMMY